MKSSHREDSSRAECSKAQAMLMGKEKHFEQFTVMMHSPFSQETQKPGKSPMKLLEASLPLKQMGFLSIFKLSS